MPAVPRHSSVKCITPSGFHRMAYVEWGDPANPRVLVCAHGLTRTGRDFDDLAAALAPHYRVVCPDVAGRGASEWLRNPMEYQVPVYAADMVALIARLGVEEVHWVGTSMGGLIGMTLACLPGSPVTRLVLNDVGPVVSGASLKRIAAYVGKAPIFPAFAAAEAYVRVVSAPFGPHSDEQWRRLTEHVVRRDADGRYRMHYDPALAVPFAQDDNGKDMALWPYYDAIRCPVLLTRGAESDLLTHATAQAMCGRGPKAKLVEFAGVGHAPTFMHADQIAAVKSFLLDNN
ncbi:MAG: alpha/beta hydrolase [Betaproteobacteria bacterium]|nr:alpha/beta hydrolase [Betaproteobacteria bacterium]